MRHPGGLMRSESGNLCMGLITHPAIRSSRGGGDRFMKNLSGGDASRSHSCRKTFGDFRMRSTESQPSWWRKRLHPYPAKCADEGKKAAGFMQATRNLMPDCQSAVPVWIMPLSRVVENFDIMRNRFDVVIVDEASQADLLALTAIYLGKQTMVVGDHQQVSPLAVGLDLERMEHLIQALLDGVPNKELYDGLASIYEMAQRSYKAIMLVEHASSRCGLIEDFPASRRRWLSSRSTKMRPSASSPYSQMSRPVALISCCNVS